MNALKDQVVLITGGSRGIGAACSRLFAREGAHIAINYLKNSKTAHAFLQTLPKGNHQLFQGDISDPVYVKKIVDEVASKYGKIDILINNAGIHEEHPIEATNYEDWVRIWKETMATNLYGPANLMYCVANVMMKKGYGRIVNISSRGAFRGEPDQPAYGASKAGMNSLTQSMAKKLAPQGIGVAAVAPCFVATDMVSHILNSERGAEIKKQSPFNRVALPEDVAYGALCLAKRDAEFLSGTILDVNGASYLRS